MRRIIFLTSLLLIGLNSYSQLYPPINGQIGSTAIHKNNSSFVAWATEVQVNRGYKKISDPTLGYASAGESSNAIGMPNSAIVSLGDRGEAIITFDVPIIDGNGFDFAVFENGSISYLELAIVTVSSDGVNYFGFQTHSQTQTNTQIGTFETPHAEYLNNIAGKYEGNYGTPFDLNEIPNNPLLDKNNITHIKITDVVGSIEAQYATYDSFGNAINDSYPTAFQSGGFDLDAVGVINQKTLGLNEFNLHLFSIYPNPATNTIFIKLEEQAAIVIYDLYGRKIKSFPKGNYTTVDISNLPSGSYLIEVLIDDKREIKKMIIQ